MSGGKCSLEVKGAFVACMIVWVFCCVVVDRKGLLLVLVCSRFLWLILSFLELLSSRFLDLNFGQQEQALMSLNNSSSSELPLFLMEW